MTNRIRANAIASRTISIDGVGFSDLSVRDSQGTIIAIEAIIPVNINKKCLVYFLGREIEHRYDGNNIVVTWKQEFTKGEERDLITTYLFSYFGSSSFSFSRSLCVF